MRTSCTNCLSSPNASIGDMAFQAVRTRFPLRIAARMTELGHLKEARGIVQVNLQFTIYNFQFAFCNFHFAFRVFPSFQSISRENPNINTAMICDVETAPLK